MHPDQRPLDQSIETVWLAALANAGISSEAALLYTFAGPKSERGWIGWHLPANRTVYRDVELPEIDDLLEELNGEAVVPATKVLVWVERRIEEVAATIRH